MKLMKVGILITGRVASSVKNASLSAAKSQGLVGRAIRKVNRQFVNAKSARKYGRILSDLKKKQRGLGHSSKSLNGEIEAAARRYREARRAASKYGAEIGRVERGQRRLNQTNDRAGTGPSRREVGTAIAAVGGAALGFSVGGAMTRARQRSYLQTVINAKDGDAAAAVERSRLAAREFARSKNTIATETELYEVEYIMNSAGLQEDAARAGSQIAHTLATVTKGQSADVANIIGGVFKQFSNDFEGTAEQQMRQIGNTLAYVQLKYKIKDFDQLGEGFKQASSTASAMNISMADTATVIGLLNNAGVEASRAGTTFDATFRNMSKAADQLGFSMQRTKDGQLDVAANINEIEAALDGLDIDERANILRKIFGDEGMKGIIPLLNSAGDLSKELAATVEKQNSTLLSDKYKIIAEDDLANLQRFKENIVGFGTGIGRAILPPINMVLGATGKVLGVVGSLIDRVPFFGAAIGTVAGLLVLLGAALAATTTATWAWGLAMKAASSHRLVGFVMTLTKGLWRLAVGALPAVIAGTRALGRAMMANPIGAIIGVIAIGGLLLIKYWKPVSAFFARLWKGVQGPLIATWNMFKKLFSWTPLGLLMQNWRPAAQFVGAVLIAPFAAVKNIWGGVKRLFSWSPLGSLAQNWQPAAQFVGAVLIAPFAAVKNIWGGVKKLFNWSPASSIKAAWKNLPDLFKGVMGRVKAIIGSAMERVKSFIIAPLKIVGKLWDKIKGVASKAGDVASAVGDGLKTASRPAVIAVGVTALTAAPSLAENAPEIASFPSAAVTAAQSPTLPPPVTTTVTNGDSHYTFNIHVSEPVTDARELARLIGPEIQLNIKESADRRLHD